MSQYLPKLYEPFGGDINIKVNLSNYATKLDLKNATGLDTYKLTTKSELASLKPEVDKIDVGKLKTLPTDLSKLSYVVKNEVIKKTVDFGFLAIGFGRNVIIFGVDMSLSAHVDQKIKDILIIGKGPTHRLGT